MARDAVTISTTSSIRDILRDAWNLAAVDAPFQLSYGFLASCEGRPGESATYFVARLGDDPRIVGALPCYVRPAGASATHDPLPLLAEVSGASSEHATVANAGTGHAFRNGVVVAPWASEEECATIRGELHRAAAAHAASSGAGALAYAYLTTSEARALVAALPEAPLVAVAHDAEASIELPSGSFDDYLAGLSSRRRMGVRKDLRTFEARGYELEETTLAGWEPTLGRLSANVFRRHGEDRTDESRTTRLTALAEGLGDAARVLVLRDDADVVGFVLFARWGDTVHVLEYGLDFDRAGDHAEYFALTYYLPIQWAQAQDCARLNVGTTSLDAKSARGATIAPLWMVATGAATSAATIAMTDARNLSYVEELARTYPRVEVVEPEPGHDAPAGRRDAILLIGGANGRNPELFSAVADRGFVALVLDSPAFEPGLERLRHDESYRPLAAHAFVGADDRAGAWTVVGDWERTFRIRGLINIREAYVELAAELAAVLGVPSPGMLASIVCADKARQREHLAEWGPDVVRVPPDARDGFDVPGHGPWVVKPTRRHSGSGVVLVRDSGALSAIVSSYPPAEEVLVEAFVEGPEFSVETLVQHGRIVFAGVTQKCPFDGAGDAFVEYGNTFPAAIPDAVRERILAVNAQVLDRLELRDGMAHGEFRVAADGTPHLIEIAARRPGWGILNLYQLATGEAIERAMVDIAIGQPAAYPAPTRCAREACFTAPVGEALEDVRFAVPFDDSAVVFDGEQVWPAIGAAGDAGSSGVAATVVTARRGAVVEEPAQDDSMAGFMLLTGATHRELDAVEAQARAAMRIDVRPSPTLH